MAEDEEPELRAAMIFRRAPMLNLIGCIRPARMYFFFRKAADNSI
jgi:hypothetical protein